MSNLLVSDEADDDLLNIIVFIAQDSVPAAIKVEQDFQRSYRLLAANPLIGMLIVPSQSERRIWNCTGRISAYRIIYRTMEKGIEILQVMHGAMDFPSTLREE